LTIIIEKLEFETIIGILDFERVTPQRVTLDIEISYTYTEKNFINYAKVVEALIKLFQEEKFLLLEDAVQESFLFLKKNYKEIEKISLKIMKPEILKEANVGIKDEISFTTFNSP